jgi:hypothetical protein
MASREGGFGANTEAGCQHFKRIDVAFPFRRRTINSPSRRWMAFSRASMYFSVLTILCASRTASALLEPVQYVL